MTTTLPNMGLTIPVVGVTVGTEWATAINNSMGFLDLHDHSSGKGVRINQNSILFSGEFSYNDHGASDVAYHTYVAQTSDPDNLSLYFKGQDLYVKTGSG